MNFLQTLLQGEPAWFIALLGLSLQAALLAAIVFVALKLIGRWIPPTWRALLWFVVILRVLIPFSPPSAFSFQNFLAKPPAPASSTKASVGAAYTLDLPVDLPIVDEVPSRVDAVKMEEPRQSKILMRIWSLGVVFGLMGLLVRYAIIRRHLALKSPAPDIRIAEELAECREKVGTTYPVRIAVSNRIAAPALTGLFPARLIIPTDFARRNLTEAQVRHVLLHELAHLRLGHLFLHWLALTARALHWFNPVLHFAAARLREECELAADAAALKGATETERCAYGETILKVLSETVAPSSQLALGMAEQARHLEKRLRAVTAPSRMSFGFLGALLLAIMTAGGLSGADNKNPDEPEKPYLTDIKTEPALAQRSQTAEGKTNSPVKDLVKAVQQARLLIELGRFEEAKRLLEDGEKVDTNHPAIRHYSRLVDEQIESRRQRTNGLSKQFRLPGPEDRWNDPWTNPRGYEKPNLEAVSPEMQSSYRQKLSERLKTIRFEEYSVGKETNLVDVLKELGSAIKKRDPSGKGVNLLISQAMQRPVRVNGAGVIDPLTGIPPSTDAKPEIDTEKFRIKFDAPLRDVSLKELLDRIVAVAKPPVGSPPNKPLKYSVEDYAVVFSVAEKTSQLYTRTYKLAPALLLSKLPTTNQATLQKEIREFFARAGVEFGEGTVGTPDAPSVGQKALFYNDRAGILFVRAPLEDLDKVENALHSLNIEAAQMSFQVRVFEIDAATQFDLFNDLKPAREVMTTNEYLFALPNGVIGNEAQVNDAKEIVKKLNVPVNSIIATARSSEYVVTNERARQLEDRIGVLPGVEKVPAPTLTTAVGRLSIISVQQTMTVVTENAVVKDDRITDGTVRLDFGTIVWLKPEVVTDESMRFKVTFNFPQFLGYAKETEKPLPRIRLRSTEVSTSIPHGHTQVIVVPPHPARSPMVDDRRYVIFLTPAVIDSRGMPVFK